MQKRAPTLGNILVIVLFALSCFGLLLFLWESFGGPVPLKPKGYQFTISFPRALALAEQSDVRISGVEVGHVVALSAGHEGHTIATVELASQYAPIRADTHAILRQKTLLGETYVQLIPQGVPLGRSGPYLPDGGRLPESQVEPSVTLDQILSLLDPKTRRDFQVWMQSVQPGLAGRGEPLNADFAILQPFTEHANQLVSVLASQEGALTAVIRNTGEVADALTERDNQFQGLIVNGQRTFHAFAQESQAFARAWTLFPTFERNSTHAFRELDRFSTIANPFFDEFAPTQRALSAFLRQAEPFAPAFDRFLTVLGPLTKAAQRGLPAFQQTNKLTIPLLENIRPVLHNFDPFLEFLGDYIPEVQAFFANLTAATQAHLGDSNTQNEGPTTLHYLRTMQVFTPESLAIYTQRVGVNRANPYFQPGSSRTLSNGGLQVFETGSCANSAPAVNGPPNSTISSELLEQLIKFKVANPPEKPEGLNPSNPANTAPPGAPNQVPAPACTRQAPFTFNGQTSQYPHVTYGGQG